MLVYGQTSQGMIDDKLNKTYRYLDDVFSVYNSDFYKTLPRFIQKN